MKNVKSEGVIVEPIEPIVYGRDQSQKVAGVAILLMLFHHMFGFSDYLKAGVICLPVFSQDVMVTFALFSKMCVAVFAFNTGYAMWSKKESYTYVNVFQRLARFLLQYWTICLLFIVYALLVGDNLPSSKQFLCNMFGLQLSFHDYVSSVFAWYVHFYVVIMLLAPLLLRVFNLKGFVLNVLIAGGLVALTFVLRKFCNNFIVSDLVMYLSSVLMGLLVCKFNLFQVIDNFLKPRSTFFCLVILLLLIPIRKLLRIDYLALSQDSIWVLVLIYCLLSIFRNIKSVRFGCVLAFLGKYSMNMWFIHAIFFTGTLDILQRVLYLPKYSLLVFVWGVCLVLPMAMICTDIQHCVLNFVFRSKRNSHIK